MQNKNKKSFKHNSICYDTIDTFADSNFEKDSKEWGLPYCLCSENNKIIEHVWE